MPAPKKPAANPVPEAIIEPEEEGNVTPTREPMSEEDAQIAALQAALVAPVALPKRSARPVPEDKLSQKQKEIRSLEDQLAQRTALALERAEPELAEATGDEVIVVHVVEDGFTAQGQVWYRGQELAFPVGSEVHEQTFNRHGVSWLDQSEDDQIRRYGSVKFRRGPWPYAVPTEFAQAEARRARKVPYFN